MFGRAGGRGRGAFGICYDCCRKFIIVRFLSKSRDFPHPRHDQARILLGTYKTELVINSTTAEN